MWFVFPFYDDAAEVAGQWRLCFLSVEIYVQMIWSLMEIKR